MIQTVEAVVEADGRVRLLGEVQLTGPRRALVMVLEEPAAVPGEAALLAESALADWNRPEEDAPKAVDPNSLLDEAALADWNRPEEDAAWSHLQPAK